MKKNGRTRISVARLLGVMEAKIDGAREIANQTNVAVGDVQSKVKYITEEISVNGATGLQAVLHEQHKDIKTLTGKVDVMWNATEKLRSKFALLQSIRKYAVTHPFVDKLVRIVFGKIVMRLAIAAATILVALMAGDSAVHVVEKIIHLLGGK